MKNVLIVLMVISILVVCCGCIDVNATHQVTITVLDKSVAKGGVPISFTYYYIETDKGTFEANTFSTYSKMIVGHTYNATIRDISGDIIEVTDTSNT